MKGFNLDSNLASLQIEDLRSRVWKPVLCVASGFIENRENRKNEPKTGQSSKFGNIKPQTVCTSNPASFIRLSVGFLST
jgi:hypothetical protein